MKLNYPDNASATTSSANERTDADGRNWKPSPFLLHFLRGPRTTNTSSKLGFNAKSEKPR